MTKQKDFRDDDGDSVRDRLFDELAEAADGYMALFGRLAERAQKHGFSTFLVLSFEDPLTGYTAQRSMTQGNYYQNIGAATAALNQKVNEG